VKVNQQDKYLRQRSPHSKVIIQTHTDTHIRAIALPDH